MRHILKLWPGYFQAKIDGLNRWEHRHFTEGPFSVGDEVIFHEWETDLEGYTGRVLGPVTITYVLQVSDYDLWTHTMPATTETKENSMRHVTDHIVNPCNDKIVIAVTDQPGSGGANHRYEITGFDTEKNDSRKDSQGYASSFSKQVILFQNGPINEKGVNGLTQEVLLAIVADRLRSFQAGPYACKENACALTHVEEALHWLQQRTLARMRRGVEGTNAP
jgi:hypothetical protein